MPVGFNGFASPMAQNNTLSTKPIRVHMPPAICKMPWVDKTYAIAGSTWVEVPAETKLEDISKYMVFDGWLDVCSHEVEYEVDGSRGNKYRVRCDSEGIWSCTCPGFGFRRKCKHVADKMKKK